MTTADTIFSGSIPAIYDRYLGPLIFEPYANDIARRLSGFTAGRLLETAAGTGVVTRRLAAALPREVHITATDLNQPMLDFAASTLSSARVTWQRVDAQALPFADSTFDVVVCQFGVMFFPDRKKAYGEAWRVLKPGGRCIVNAWDAIEHNDFADVVTAALAEMFPHDPPRFLARTPHGHHAKDVILAEVRKAGFRQVTLATVTERSQAPSPRHPAIGYCQGTPLRAEIEARDATQLAPATELAAARLGARFGDGTVVGNIRAHVVEAVR